MQSVMNLKIEYRESFRPFAPSVLREHVSEWFELDVDSPYMLLVADVTPQKRIEISESEAKLTGLEKLKIKRYKMAAVAHVDYSARIRTVTRKTIRVTGRSSRFFESERAVGNSKYKFQRARRANRLHSRRQLSLFHAYRDGLSCVGKLCVE